MKKYFLILIPFTLFISITNQASACMFPESFEESVEKYDLIFTGKYGGCSVEAGQEHIVIKSSNIWKGEKYDVYKHQLPCNKRYLQEGKKYLIYSYMEAGSNQIVPVYNLGSCSRTRIVTSWWYTLFQKIIRYFGVEEVHISHVREDIAKLNKLFKKD